MYVLSGKKVFVCPFFHSVMHSPQKLQQSEVQLDQKLRPRGREQLLIQIDPIHPN